MNGRPILICASCHRPKVVRRPSDVQRYRFCSHQCYWASMRAKSKPAYIKECPVCHRLKTTTIQRQVHCSRSCALVARAKTEASRVWFLKLREGGRRWHEQERAKRLKALAGKTKWEIWCYAKKHGWLVGNRSGYRRGYQDGLRERRGVA